MLRTSFAVEAATNTTEQNIILNDGTTLNIEDRNLLAGNIAKFDLACTLYEHHQNQTISVSLNGSLDIYDKATISSMASRLKKVFDQLFSVSSIYQFTLLLPHELDLIRHLNCASLDYNQAGCIHWEFANQVNQHPQKVALSLEDGSMTYGELLYYAQQLANQLITKYAVQPGQTICQLMDRSFEMVIGMISIWISGGVYTPLNLHDPFKRMSTCIQQTDARVILVHQSTYDSSLSGYLLLSIDQVICFAQTNEEVAKYIDDVNVTSEDISHILFTSDSTESLKAVS